MRPFAAAILAAAPLLAQIPEIPGKPVDQATLRYIDIKPGDGALAAFGKQFTVNYTGWLRDGTQFDSSIGKQPLTFVQGRRQVIAGFDVGFEGMKVGGKRRIFIPFQLAYGEQQRGKIPPRSELIFDVELLDVKDASATPGPAADLLFPFGNLEKQAVDLAKAIPEDKYDWRPAPGVRSIREVCLHIAYGNHLMLDISNGLKGDDLYKRINEQVKKEGEKMSKADIVAAMTESFATIREALTAATAGSLSRDVDFFGNQTNRRSVLTSLDVHIAEHLGQLIAYARTNGVVPPWSK